MMERPIKENYDFRETNYAYSYRYEKDMIEYCEHLESKLKNLGVIGSVSESTFVEEFTSSVTGDMYEHEDDCDYSQGMKQMDKDKIETIGRELYDELYFR